MCSIVKVYTHATDVYSRNCNMHRYIVYSSTDSPDRVDKIPGQQNNNNRIVCCYYNYNIVTSNLSGLCQNNTEYFILSTYRGIMLSHRLLSAMILVAFYIINVFSGKLPVPSTTVFTPGNNMSLRADCWLLDSNTLHTQINYMLLLQDKLFSTYFRSTKTVQVTQAPTLFHFSKNWLIENPLLPYPGAEIPQVPPSECIMAVKTPRGLLYMILFRIKTKTGSIFQIIHREPFKHAAWAKQARNSFSQFFKASKLSKFADKIDFANDAEQESGENNSSSDHTSTIENKDNNYPMETNGRVHQINVMSGSNAGDDDDDDDEQKKRRNDKKIPSSCEIDSLPDQTSESKPKAKITEDEPPDKSDNKIQDSNLQWKTPLLSQTTDDMEISISGPLVQATPDKSDMLATTPGCNMGDIYYTGTAKPFISPVPRTGQKHHTNLLKASRKSLVKSKRPRSNSTGMCPYAIPDAEEIKYGEKTRHMGNYKEQTPRSRKRYVSESAKSNNDNDSLTLGEDFWCVRVNGTGIHDCGTSDRQNLIHLKESILETNKTLIINREIIKNAVNSIMKGLHCIIDNGKLEYASTLLTWNPSELNLSDPDVILNEYTESTSDLACMKSLLVFLQKHIINVTSLNPKYNAIKIFKAFDRRSKFPLNDIIQDPNTPLCVFHIGKPRALNAVPKKFVPLQNKVLDIELNDETAFIAYPETCQDMSLYIPKERPLDGMDEHIFIIPCNSYVNVELPLKTKEEDFGVEISCNDTYNDDKACQTLKKSLDGNEHDSCAESLINHGCPSKIMDTDGLKESEDDKHNQFSENIQTQDLLTEDVFSSQPNISSVAEDDNNSSISMLFVHNSSPNETYSIKSDTISTKVAKLDDEDNLSKSKPNNAGSSNDDNHKHFRENILTQDLSIEDVFSSQPNVSNVTEDNNNSSISLLSIHNSSPNEQCSIKSETISTKLAELDDEDHLSKSKLNNVDRSTITDLNIVKNKTEEQTGRSDRSEMEMILKGNNDDNITPKKDKNAVNKVTRDQIMCNMSYEEKSSEHKIDPYINSEETLSQSGCNDKEDNHDLVNEKAKNSLFLQSDIYKSIIKNLPSKTILECLDECEIDHDDTNMSSNKKLLIKHIEKSLIGKVFLTTEFLKILTKQMNDPAVVTELYNFGITAGKKANIRKKQLNDFLISNFTKNDALTDSSQNIPKNKKQCVKQSEQDTVNSVVDLKMIKSKSRTSKRSAVNNRKLISQNVNETNRKVLKKSPKIINRTSQRNTVVKQRNKKRSSETKLPLYFLQMMIHVVSLMPRTQIVT